MGLRELLDRDDITADVRETIRLAVDAEGREVAGGLPQGVWAAAGVVGALLLAPPMTARKKSPTDGASKLPPSPDVTSAPTVWADNTLRLTASPHSGHGRGSGPARESTRTLPDRIGSSRRRGRS